MDNPSVSVVIPLFNHERYIQQTVNSVLAQTFEDFELIIIDDGSRDGSADIVQGFDDARIRFYRQENQGAHNTINRGIELAEGEFIAILNSDDLYDPRRLEKCYALVEENPKIGAVFSDVECIDEHNNHLYDIGCTPPYKNKGKRVHEDQLVPLDLLGLNFLTTTSNLFCRRDVFNVVQPFRPFRYCHDWDFFLRLIDAKDVRVIREPLLRYRIHSTNTLKEDRANVYFEIGVLLADFLHQHKMYSWVDGGEFTLPAELFRSLHEPYVDRVLAVLGIYQHKEDHSPLVPYLIEDPQNPLRKACLEYIRHLLDNDDYHQLVLQENRKLHQDLENCKKQNTVPRGSFIKKIIQRLAG